MINPYKNEDAMPYTITGPAIVNICDAVPKIKPSC